MGNRKIYTNLQEMTAQESGVVVHGDEYLICNWSHGEGLPFAGPWGGVLHIPKEMCVVKRLRMKDIGGHLKGLECVYDRNEDLEGLSGWPGMTYEINGGALIIAPKDWN